MSLEFSPARAGRSIVDFCRETNIGRTTAYKLIGQGKIAVAKVGRRTIVTTQPSDFLAQFAAGIADTDA